MQTLQPDSPAHGAVVQLVQKVCVAVNVPGPGPAPAPKVPEKEQGPIIVPFSSSVSVPLNVNVVVLTTVLDAFEKGTTAIPTFIVP